MGAAQNDLYERATGPLRALWHVGTDVSVFIGPLGRNGRHSHSVPVLLVGVYGAFQLRLHDGAWRKCTAAVIPTGVHYEFDMHGEPLAVIYLEPAAGATDTLVPLLANTDAVGGAIVGDSEAVRALRELFETRADRDGVDAALSELIRFGATRSRRPVDKRVGEVLQQLCAGAELAMPVSTLASAVGLSSSRLQHLFTAETGVPYRRYRAWRRMLCAVQEAVGGANLTQAAHSAGYCDQAHFAREFRRIFGAPARSSLSDARGA